MENPAVTLVESATPTAQVLAKANAEITLQDSLGRTIVLRKPGVLAQFRLVEMMGDSAKNETYMGMVLPIIYVVSIDGITVSPPAKKSEVEALIQRLDEHGIRSVMAGVVEHFGGLQDPAAAREALKK